MTFQYNAVELKQICNCSCMTNLYKNYESFIDSSKYGDIYRKIINNNIISEVEYQSLLDFIICDMPIYNNSCNRSFKGRYTNKLEINDTDSNAIYSDCKYRFSMTYYQEYDECGPIDEGEVEVYDCRLGYGIGQPSSYSIMIITFFLNIITQNSCISHYNSSTANCIKSIIEYCKYINKITFSLFKGFETYNKLLKNG
jgi:hypothetical protein